MPGSATDEVPTSLHGLRVHLDHGRAEADVEAAGDGDVEHGVEQVLVLALGDLADREALVAFLQLERVRRVAGDPVDRDLVERVAGGAEAAAQLVDRLAQGRPALRVGELGDLLLERAECRPPSTPGTCP